MTGVRGGPRERAEADPGQVLAFDVLQRDVDLEALRSAWAELHGRCGTRNPFAHPAWMIPWLRLYVPATGDRVVLTVRRGGELVAVAPFYRRLYGIGRARARVLQLAGASPGPVDRLTEMREVLALPRQRRRILRALLHHVALSVGGWDWLDVSLPAEHGWFESQWLPESWQSGGANVVHKATRPFVVLPLPPAFDELPLKRNQREALRRARNRLAAAPGEVRITFAEGAEAVGAIEVVETLHRRRASVHGHLHHEDYLDSPEASVLLREAAAGWAEHGDLCGALLHLGDEPIAGRLLLGADRGVFLSLSGADPEHWRLCGGTALLEACIRRAIEQGADTVNFSSGVDSGKLRWSEQLALQHDFVVVAPGRRARSLFAAWWQLRARRALAASSRFVRAQAAAQERP